MMSHFSPIASSLCLFPGFLNFFIIIGLGVNLFMFILLGDHWAFQTYWWELFIQFGTFIVITFFKNFVPFSLSTFPGTIIISMLIGLTSLYRVLRVSVHFSSILFSLCSLHQLISIDLSSNILIIFPVLNLLLVPVNLSF